MSESEVKPTGRSRRRMVRLIALLLGIAAMLVVIAVRGLGDFASGFPPIGGTDFVQYWSSARLLLEGGNPYDPASLFDLQQAAGSPRSEPLLMWNPPWVLALLLPFALVPFKIATLLWLLVQVGLLLVSGALLWGYFAPGDRRYWIGLILALAFAPTLFALRIGQISPWLLAGIVGFLWAERKRLDGLAGVFLAMQLIKPQIAYLFWLAALWWAWRSGRRRVLVGWLLTLAAACLLVLVVSPGVYAHYLGAASEPPLKWATPTLGTWLRLAFRPAPSGLQFLPSVVGLLGLAVWLWRRRGPWRWEGIASSLLLASIITTSFGWIYDQVVLLPVVVDMVSRLRGTRQTERAAVLGVLVGMLVVLLVQNHYQIGDQYSVWNSWALAGLYAWTVHFALPRQEKATSGGVR